MSAHKYNLKKRNGEGEDFFMHVTPSIRILADSPWIRNIVTSDMKQLVVNLETGLLTLHNKPKKKEPLMETPENEEIQVYYKYIRDREFYILYLPKEINEAIKLLKEVFYMYDDGGVIIVKGRPEITAQAVGNFSNIERATRRIYRGLGLT